MRRAWARRASPHPSPARSSTTGRWCSTGGRRRQEDRRTSRCSRPSGSSPSAPMMEQIDALGETAVGALSRLLPEMAARRPAIAARAAAWGDVDRSWLLGAVADCLAGPGGRSRPARPRRPPVGRPSGAAPPRTPPRAGQASSRAGHLPGVVQSVDDAVERLPRRAAPRRPAGPTGRPPRSRFGRCRRVRHGDGGRRAV